MLINLYKKGDKFSLTNQANKEINKEIHTVVKYDSVNGVVYFKRFPEDKQLSFAGICVIRRRRK